LGRRVVGSAVAAGGDAKQGKSGNGRENKLFHVISPSKAPASQRTVERKMRNPQMCFVTMRFEL
jgi:hypothetical protein